MAIVVNCNKEVEVEVEALFCSPSKREMKKIWTKKRRNNKKNKNKFKDKGLNLSTCFNFADAVNNWLTISFVEMCVKAKM